jgi:tetratricopeptide (TPR) repeat protein
VLRLLPGIAVSGLFPNQAVVFTKNLSITTALPAVVVDGAVYEQSILNAITPDEIEQVSLLKSANATLRYGQLGAGGAILIVTKMAARNNLKEAEKPPSLLVEGNEYDESVRTIERLPNTASYLLELQAATTFDAAKRIYEEQTASGTNNTVSYYVSVSDYFLKWDSDFSFTVLSNIAREATNNPRALKTYAYKLEERGETLKALNVYNRILALRPEQAQSYRDVAKASEAVGDYQTAFALYYQIIYNSIPNVDCTGILDIAINEMLHLLAFHKNKVPYETLPNDFLASKLKEDIRMVLEWNTPAKDFEAQFVSPDNKFFIWNHTKFTNKELLEQEVAQGFAMKEQLVDEKSKGIWRVNIRYFDEDPENNPTYLKYTLYQNYGQPNETKKIKVVNLARFTEKITLDTFLYE